MTRTLGLPVPPGFTITTQACRRYLESGWPAELDRSLEEALAGLEAAAGRRLGDPSAPLLLSVRSGAPVSMPGMMDTVLDVGLDAGVVEGLAAVSGDRAFALDCDRRLRVMYRDVVGAELPAGPREQLRASIEAVFRSWDGERARAYRRAEGIDDALGTAVVVQAMVFVNLGAEGATGVCFSRDPATGERRLYGDVLFGAQGEDVVDGTHDTAPLAELDRRLPEAGAELRRLAELLERHFADLVDIEFTVERGRLWLLQVRVGKRSPAAAVRIAHDMALDAEFPLGRVEAVARVRHLLDQPPRSLRAEAGATPVAQGLGASPGLVAGVVVVTAEAAVEHGVEGVDAILVRPETSPADVAGMAEAVGLLTARGGLASHAAVVARGWGKPAVVGTEALVVGEDHVRFGDRRVEAGEEITIDGATGAVYLGRVQDTGTALPEVSALLAWAAERAT
ncbi:MAG: phosphate kinase [Acidimicrobiia bacterium]|nr:phosphate kinase [Acidimicrobiia bacterium]